MNSIRTGLLLSFSFILISFSSFAQSTFHPLECAGEIPIEFRTLTASKVQKAQAAERKKEYTYKEKSRIDEFLLKNNYIIDELLTSGKILFGDSLTNYVNEVAAILLNGEDELFHNLRFYVVKSDDINAFATNQGIIFITVGLLAQIENEAQLAFVLAHEIAHYEKKHSIASVLESQRVYNNTNNDRYTGSESRMKLLSAFSKDMEFQADSLGFYRFTKGGYKKEAASTMMDVLQWAFLPFEDVEFTTAFLELDSLRIPNSFQLDSVAAIPLFNDETDDTESSHPNIRKRREKIESMISLLASSNGKLNLIGKSKFERMQAIARREMIHLDLINNEYFDALYNSYSLLKKNPNDQFLEESIGKALYGITKYKNSNDLQDAGVGSGESYGNIQNCFYLFESLDKEQVALISLRYLLAVTEKYHSSFMESLLKDLIQESIEKNEISFDSIKTGREKCLAKVAESKKTTEKKPEIDTALSESEAKADSTSSEEGESKFAKLREGKKKAETDAIVQAVTTGDKNPWTEIFHFRAFENYDLKILEEKFTAIQTSITAAKKTNEEYISDLQKRKKYYKRHGYALGIDKVVFVDPFYFELDQRNGLHLEDSEKELIEFKEQIAQCAKTSGLASEILSRI